MTPNNYNTDLRELSNKFKNIHIDYSNPQNAERFFDSKQVPGFAVYLSDMQSGHIIRQHGLNEIFSTNKTFKTLADINVLIHEDDYREIKRILQTLFELGIQKGISTGCKLEIAYRCLYKSQYRKFYRKSGLMTLGNQKKVLVWSQLFPADALSRYDKLLFSWTDHYFKTSEIILQLNRQERSVFTRMELELAEILKEGATNAEIAEELFISTNTVKKHLSNMFKKVGVKNRTALLRFFRRGDTRSPKH